MLPLELQILEVMSEIKRKEQESREGQLGQAKNQFNQAENQQDPILDILKALREVEPQCAMSSKPPEKKLDKLDKTFRSRLTIAYISDGNIKLALGGDTADEAKRRASELGVEDFVLLSKGPRYRATQTYTEV